VSFCINNSAEIRKIDINSERDIWFAEWHKTKDLHRLQIIDIFLCRLKACFITTQSYQSCTFYDRYLNVLQADQQPI
jgi:hypothetical protein